MQSDLEHMSIEIVVKDDSHLRSSKPMGRVEIGRGPNLPHVVHETFHWEQMIKQSGKMLRMIHALHNG